jgi:hypothetical protein
VPQEFGLKCQNKEGKMEGQNRNNDELGMGGRIMPRNGEFWYGEMNRTNFGKDKMKNMGKMWRKCQIVQTNLPLSIKKNGFKNGCASMIPFCKKN